MCCFSRPVKHVSATSIFARMLGDGRQALVYSMNFESAEDLAMVLPLPVVPGAGEDAVEFVDLSGYDRFFVDLATAFPVVYEVPLSRGVSLGAPPRQTLVVHDVGDFQASWVPTRADFARLDPRFRLDDAVWHALPGYADYGFAVFKLEATHRARFFGLFGSGGRKTVHPMAFTFPSRTPETLFFPTVHVHDGHVPTEARFDHSLYAQWPVGASAPAGGDLHWHASAGPVGQFVDGPRTADLVDGAADCWRATVTGVRPNADIRI